MSSSVEEVFRDEKLTELILVELDCPVEITRVQTVCRTWRDIIRRGSLAISKTLWYIPDDPDDRVPNPSKHKLNPVFNRIGITLQSRLIFGVTEEYGDINFRRPFINTPGPCKGMLATQPPCKRMEIYSQGMMIPCWEIYAIESTTGYLRMGDVMTVLGELEFRQQYDRAETLPFGLDIGMLVPLRVDAPHLRRQNYDRVFQAIPDDVCIKVVVVDTEKRIGPAFSLQRRFLNPNPDESAKGSNENFRDLTSHEVIHYDKNMYPQSRLRERLD